MAGLRGTIFLVAISGVESFILNESKMLIILGGFFSDENQRYGAQLHANFLWSGTCLFIIPFGEVRVRALDALNR